MSASRSPLGAGAEVRRLVALGGPVALTQLGAMFLGVVDTLMLGQLGVHELDAAALGNVWLWGTMIMGMGLILGLDPIISRAHGAGDGPRAALALQQGLVLAVIAAVPIGATWWLTEPALRLMGQDPELSAQAAVYVWTQAPAIAPFLGYFALRQYLQGRNLVTPALWVMLVANVFNIVANWALIFGHLGLPAMGLRGAAIATSLTRTFTFVGLVGWIWMLGLHQGAWVPWSRRALEREGLREIVGHGGPVAIQYGLEVWAFQVATLMAGWLGEDELAAHTIVLNLASISFMLPLGVSIGGATRVGNLIGAGRAHEAQRSAWIALLLGGGVMLACAGIFVGLRWSLPPLYNSHGPVILLAATLLPVAAAFQLFDGVQVVGGGILRGQGNTVPAAVANLVGYYALGIPLAWLLAFTLGWGIVGVWVALASSLAVVAAILVGWIGLRGPATLAAEAEREASRSDLSGGLEPAQ